MAARHERFSVRQEEEGHRLDRVVSAHVPSLSRSAAAALARSGAVLVDGEPSKPSRRLRSGQEVEVLLPDAERERLRPEAIPLEVLYEDEYLLVVNKPPGMVVHPAPGSRDGTLAAALLARYPRIGGFADPARPGVVHRLDKDTSGAIVLALTERVRLALSAAIARREVARVYWALAWGEPPDEFTVEAPIARSPRDRKRMAVVPGGRRAVTHFRRLEQFPGVALLECRLETGRTHQIRVHAHYAGFPLLGEATYTTRRLRGAGRDLIGRQALHAVEVRFTHPVTGQALEVKAPLAPDFAEALERLRGVSSFGHD